MDALKRSLGLSVTSEGSMVNSMVIVDRVGAPPVLEETSNSNQSPEESLQVRDRLANIWNNMKFSKTMWSLEGGTKRISRLSPAWLLGQSYHNSSSRSSSFSGSEPSAEDDTKISPLMADFMSKIWMTYRKDFQCFSNSLVDTDCGWGCMIRAGQMIVANALIEVHFGRAWRWKPMMDQKVLTGEDIHNEALHRDIVRLFADQQTAPLSIHKIVHIGQTTIGCKPGDWFGPGSTAHLLRQALDSALKSSDHPQIKELLDIKIYVATDGTVFKQDVLDLGDVKPSAPKPIEAPKEDGYSVVNTPHEESFEVTHDDVAEEAVMLDDSVRSYSLSQQVSVDGETWMTEEYSAPIVMTTPSAPAQSSSWTPVLILVPVRLGSSDKVNRLYVPHVKSLLTSDLCVGIIGGRPKHALYFLGFQDDSLLHLDPHLVQDSINMNVPEFDVNSYHCRSIRKMPLSKMDPSCCLGFLCKTKKQFDEWCEFSSAQTDYPMYCVTDGRVSELVADGERFLNQMAMPEELDDVEGGAVGGASAYERNDSSSSLNDQEEFVFL